MLPKGLKNYAKSAPKFLNMGLIPPPPLLNNVQKTADLAKDGFPYAGMHASWRVSVRNIHFYNIYICLGYMQPAIWEMNVS